MMLPDLAALQDSLFVKSAFLCLALNWSVSTVAIALQVCARCLCHVLRTYICIYCVEIL
jgi:hypothetical protein